MKHHSILYLLLLFMSSLILAVSCTQFAPSSPPNHLTSTRPVIMGFSAWPGWFPWEVAREKGLFEARGVKIDLKWFDGYLDSINAMAAGRLDANTQTLNDTIASVAAGADQVIVLVNDNSTGNDKIIVREGINTIADLKGKKIAAEQGTVDHFLLLLGLQQAGLRQTDIKFIPLETGAAAAAFVAGQVDAVGVFAPFTTTALKRSGSKELFSSRDFPGAIPDHLVVSRQLIESNPEAVQGLVNTWFDTLTYLRENRAESYKIMAERARVSPAEYQQYDAGTTIFTLEDNLKAFSPGDDMVSLEYAAKKISTFLRESGLIANDPDLSKLFDSRFVKAYGKSNHQ